MTNLNQLALQYYQKNVDLIKNEMCDASYDDRDVHEQALEWTVDDIAGDIHELLDEIYDEQVGA
jgi:hypothetical protein